jgi:hypothetical protein
MRICELCHFEVEADDVALSRASGQCVCLRCYLREAGVERPMPKAFRREIEACLSALGGAVGAGGVGG